MSSMRDPIRTSAMRRLLLSLLLGGLLLLLPLWNGRNMSISARDRCWAAGNPAPAVAAPSPAALVNNVTNSFSETDIHEALIDIATQTGSTIIADASVSGTVSLDLKNIPLEKALSLVLLGGGYAFTRIEGTYLVGLPDPSNPNFALFCKSTVINLKYKTPQAIMNMLGASMGKYLSAENVVNRPAGANEGSSIGYSRSNSPSISVTGGSNAAPITGHEAGAEAYQPYQIVITAPPAMMARIIDDITQFDRAQPQVMLEASIIEISQDTLKTLGVDWATHWLSQDLSSGVGPNLVYSAISNTEMVQLSALINSNQATLRANPQVTTKDGMTAELEVGQENYFNLLTTTGGYTYGTLEDISSGILLRITPHVLVAEDEVDVVVEPQVRDVSSQGANGLPVITFRRASTDVRVKNGQSVIIGGLVNSSTSRQVNKIPLLGDIPLLGNWLFRHTSTGKITTEDVIIITPHIMTELNAVSTSPTPDLRHLIAPDAPASEPAGDKKQR